MKSLILIFTLLSINGNAQISQVSYLTSTKTELSNYHDGVNTLYFTPEKSLFVFDNWPTETSYSSANGRPSRLTGDKEGMPVFTDMLGNIQIYKSKYLASKDGPWIFTDPIPVINWSISKENKKIGPFNATHASGAFGGRTYDVWFTTDIPVPFGPYKLGGLPGMILSAASRDGVVSFEFAGYEPVSKDRQEITAPQDGIAMGAVEFKDYVIKKLLKLEAMSTTEWTTTIDVCDTNYTIEKNRWPYIAEYKQKRGPQPSKF